MVLQKCFPLIRQTGQQAQTRFKYKVVLQIEVTALQSSLRKPYILHYDSTYIGTKYCRGLNISIFLSLDNKHLRIIKECISVLAHKIMSFFENSKSLNCIPQITQANRISEILSYPDGCPQAEQVFSGKDLDATSMYIYCDS